MTPDALSLWLKMLQSRSPMAKQMMKRQRASEHATEQPPMKKIRFLNMQPEQVHRRARRIQKRKYRADADNADAESSVAKQTPKKHRPCCGRRQCNCTCKPPKGMKKNELTSLAKRFVQTALSTVQDTTDVSVWQTHMQHAAEKLPLRVLLAYAHTHVVFNQGPLLKAFVHQKAFLFKAPWFDWPVLQSIVRKHKAAGESWRSSNYRSTTLQKLVLQPHLGTPRPKPEDAVERDVLACQIVGVDAMPAAICDLYDAQPSRDFWKAIMVTWLEQVKQKCSGCFDDYYLKCTLDRLIAVRNIDHGTISWWPTECPAYQKWYKRLYPTKTLSPEEKFQVLCATYQELNRHKTCTMPDALAQTCWLEKDSRGRLHVDP